MVIRSVNWFLDFYFKFSILEVFKKVAPFLLIGPMSRKIILYCGYPPAQDTEIFVIF
jgi:hypothetical protein